MRRVILCKDNINGVSRKVSARIEDGCLEIEGRDLGINALGGGEYEYFYTFDVEETKKLATLLTGSSDDMNEFLDDLVDKFGGSMWYFTFFEYVKEHNLEYEAFSC